MLTGRIPIHVNQLTACNPGANISGKFYPDALADARMTMLPKKLAAANYVSYHVGKWCVVFTFLCYVIRFVR